MSFHPRILPLGVALLFVISAVLGGGIGTATAATSHAALDGSASTGCNGCASQSVTLAVAAGDLVLVYASSNPGGGVVTVNSVTSPGLTFAPRGDYDTMGGGMSMWSYYAVAGSTGSQEITTEMSGSGVWTLTGISVSGADTASPFDTASGSPYFSHNSCDLSCGLHFSSDTASDLIITGMASEGTPTATPSSGFTVAQTATVPSWMASAFGTQGVSGVQTGTKVSWTLSVGEVGLVMVDAIAASPSGMTTAGSTSATSTATSMMIDGSASTGCGYVTACSVSLTTTQPNDVIIVGCDCWPSGATFSVKDTAGLTFVPRESQLGIGGGQFIQTWYAISTSALPYDTISVTTTDAGETWYGVVAFAVSGASTSQPFVTEFPQSQANNLNCASPCNTGVSAPAGSFVFQIGGDTGYTLQTAGPGMTLILASKSGQDVYAQYDSLSSSISGGTLSFGTNTGGTDSGVIADAINPSSSSSVSSSSTATTTTTSASTSVTSTTSSMTSQTTTSTASTTSSSTTSATSSTTTTVATATTSAGTGTLGSGVFYLGATPTDSSGLPNTGARSWIQVQSFNVPVGCVAFWVSDDSASDLWMQVGYYICYGSVPVVFTQVWSLASYTMVYSSFLSSTPTPGIHEFAISLQSGTTWVATYDGTVVGSYNLGASVSSSSYPVYAMSEENSLAAPISIPTTSFPVAIQTLVNGVWADPASVSVYNVGGAWGLQGAGQNPDMAADSFIVGGSLPSPSNGSPL